MSKITLNNIGSGTSFQTAIPTINNNNATLTTALDNTLSRDGTSPNQMAASLDMNGNAILNLPAAVNPTSPVRLQEIGDAANQAAIATAQAAIATTQAGIATTQAGIATTQAGIATTQAGNAASSASTATTAAATSTANASVVVGNEYSFDTSTVMADPGTGKVRLNNATPVSAASIAISALTNDSGNPNIRTFIAAWDDSSNTIRGTIIVRKIGTPSTFVIYNVTGALTDNTTWLQLAVTGVTGNGTFSASDRTSWQFSRAGDAGAVSGPGVSVDSEIVLFNGTTGNSIKRASQTGILTATSGVIGVTGTGTTATLGTIELGNASDTTLSRSSAGVLAVEGNTVPMNGTSQVATFGTIELGNASDTTLSRASAGVLAVEGINLTANIPVSSKSAAYTTVLADQNTLIYHPSSDNNARTFTIDSNANVPYQVGTTLTFVNDINTVTISITADTLVLMGPGSTGSRTLAANGMATAIKVASTRWVISGTGLT